MTTFTKAEEERHDNYQRKVYENLQHNQQRKMHLQNDLQSQQRNHRLRTAWLQSRWLEVSEQERRAQIHNQKLLQDFQRAQDTLNDMVARTEAMNTLRVQYEKNLEENFPRWQQRLKDIRVSEKSERVQQHLKAYIQQLEKDEGVQAPQRSDVSGHHQSFNPPEPPQTSHTVLNPHQMAKDIKQNAERYNQIDHHSYFPPTWLTGSQPFISGLPQNNFPKDYKNLQNIQALNHPLPPYYYLPGSSLHQSHTVQQKTPSMEHPWASVRQGFVPTTHFTPAGVSWSQLPVFNPMAWGLMDVPDPGEEQIQHSETNQKKVTKESLNTNEESPLRPKQRRNRKESDRSSELDCRPVRLSSNHEGSSEGTSVSSQITDFGMQKHRKKKRDGTESQSIKNGNKSQGSSTVSEDPPDCHSDAKNSKTHKTSKKSSSKESIVTERNVDAVMQDEDEQDESRSQQIPQRNISSEKDESEGLNITEEEDSDEEDDRLLDDVAEEKISDREVEDEDEGADEEEEAELEDEQQKDDGEGSEKIVEKSDGFESSDKEEPKEEGDVQEDTADGGETTEEEERESSFHDETEAKKSQESIEDDKNINISERDINNSLEELYADETEEEVYNEEIEDDENDDDDDDDEVVVEKAHLWSREPFDDHTKCQDDEDDDDIEGLLNPVNSQTQKEDGMEKTDQSNAQHSVSEEKNPPEKNNPAAVNESEDSDDEFDHFYD